MGTTPRAPGAQAYAFRLGALTLTVFALHVAKPVILPVALALLVAFVLSPVVALVQRTRLPRIPAVLLTILIVGGAVAGLGIVVGSQLGALVRELPSHRQEIEAKMDRVRGSGGALSRVGDMIHEIAQRGDTVAPGVDEPTRVVARIEEPATIGTALERVRAVLEPVGTGGLVLVLTIFLLVGREDLRGRFLATLGRSRLVGTVRVLDESSRRIGRLLLFQLLVNAAVGALFALGLSVLGVPYALLWGVLTALLRFIPFVGTWMSLLLPLSLSVATAPGWQQPLILLGYFAAVDLITGNVVEPLLFGRHTGVSPIALLVAAAFWAWVWGPVGLIHSTPLTVCLVVLGQHVPSLESFTHLLGDRPALPPPEEFYQRALAGGAAAAAPVATAAAAGGGDAFDDVLLPALGRARRDRAAGFLSAEEEQKVRDAVAALAADRDDGEGAVGAAATGPPLVVLGTPAHDDAEQLPLALLASRLAPHGVRVEALDTRLLPADVVARVAEVGACAVVVSVMPPGGLAQAAYLCRLLRRRHPDLPIVVARWGGVAQYDQLLVRLRQVGASYLTTSIAQTAAQLRSAARGAPGGRPRADDPALADVRRPA